ncbi:Dihydropteroate synthase [Agrocybe pediades]|nr:Dihydropteroate synthase [Agrocybe pediades]
MCLQDLSRHICDTIGKLSLLKDMLDGLEVYLKVTQLRSPLHSKSISIEHFARFSLGGSWTPRNVRHVVEDIVCPAIIGINVAERLEKQDIVVNLTVDTREQGLSPQDWINVRFIVQTLYEAVSSSSYLTLEALTSFVALETLSLLKSYNPSPIVTVRIAKPSALVLAKSAEVVLSRTLDDYPLDNDGNECLPDAEAIEEIAVSAERDGNPHTVAIALGSNLGDSFKNIEYALRLLERPQELLIDAALPIGVEPFVNVVNTSFLYESAPMYVTDQPSFINCACMVETNLAPVTLLRLLKGIERTVGRVPSIRNGPRAVDLDIVFYDDKVVDTRATDKDPNDVEGELIVPHPRVQEREFVLRPLNDMIPDYVHPILKKNISTLFKDVCDPSGPPMNKVIPFPKMPFTPSSSSSQESVCSSSDIPDTLTHWIYPSNVYPSSIMQLGSRKTHVMATLNTTPDSFSDGAQHDALPAALKYAYSSVAAGATVVDIGGYSTRPGAAFVSVAEEIGRVVPAINAMRDPETLKTIVSSEDSNSSSGETGTEVSDATIQETANVLISVDTFRWEVAEAAIRVGANCINDVHAFSGACSSWPPTPEDEARAEESASKMKALARTYCVPVILMHSRGDAGKNKDYTKFAYAGEDDEGRATLEGVRVELGAKVDQIVQGKGGLRRWQVIVDPGVGFSKTLDGNLEVLRNAKEVVADVLIGREGTGKGRCRNPLAGYPQLIGVSRKSFLGAILAQDPNGRKTEPKERVWATGAAVACAVQQEALIIRVHDVQEMMDVVKVAQALWS